MTCSRVVISAYQDGALSPADRRSVEHHLRQCPACRLTLHDYQAIRRGLGGLPRYGVPENVGGELRAQVAARHLSSRRSPRWSPLVAAAAAVAVLMAAALMGGSQAQQPSDLAVSRPVVAFALPQDQATGVSPEAVIEIRFNSAVDREAVQHSLNVSPPVPARLEWQQDRVVIVPEPGLDPDTTYTISLGAAPQKSGPILFSLHTGQVPPSGDASTDRGALVPAATRTPTASVVASPSPTPISTQPAPEFRTAAAAPAEPAPVATPNCAQAPARRSGQAGTAPEGTAYAGCPRDAAWASMVTTQPFEGGTMLWSPELQAIYLLNARAGTWESYSAGQHRPNARVEEGRPPLARPTATAGAARATWTPVSLTPTRTPDRVTATGMPSGSLEGWRHLTLLWLQEATVRDALGMPTGKDLTASGSVQEFERGLLVGVEGATYFLSDDRSWRLLSHSSDAILQSAPPRVAP